MTGMAKHAVLVEDDDSTRHLFCIWLKKLGYEVTEAVNGLEGLAALELAIPDLLVTDMSMPELDGGKMVKLVIADERFDKVKIVMLTAMYVRVHEMTSRVCVLLKPVTFKQFTAACRKDGLVG